MFLREAYLSYDLKQFQCIDSIRKLIQRFAENSIILSDQKISIIELCTKQDQSDKIKLIAQ